MNPGLTWGQFSKNSTRHGMFPKFIIKISTTCVLLERFKPELYVKNKMKMGV